jgi:MoaA/NifB/PqqE/SkfB family radical SAM enzyme
VGEFTIDPDLVTAPVPKVLWIELTSKCPFDCIFCTRRTRFGAGRNLDFDIYRRLIAELEEPDFIGLNYSGESIYYPKLEEAIALAAATGAATELVTAFSTISPTLLRSIIESGLDRLAISLHTMDSAEYQTIYRFGSLDLLKRRVADFLEMKAALGAVKPRLDFCFVAMKENLHQLHAVAEYARSAGVPERSVHPIIGRHQAPYDYSRELDANRLRDGFKDELRAAVEALRSRHPGFTVNVLNPDIDPNPGLCHTPGYYSPLLPQDARIHSCDQSPFESVHVLAGGDVVVCEVHDEVSLGNLHEQPLRAIWNSDRYREFRRGYVDGSVPQCRSCVWKLAYLPGPFRPALDLSEGMSPQLMRGWYGYDGSGCVWARKHAIAALANPRLKNRIRVAGALPPGPPGDPNSVAVACNRRDVGSIENKTAAFASFETTLDLPERWEQLYIELTTSHLYRPSLHSSSSDSRDLGVAVHRIGVCD